MTEECHHTYEETSRSALGGGLFAVWYRCIYCGSSYTSTERG
jgi:hypothetical protein